MTNNPTSPHSAPWILFTYVSFAASLGTLALGIAAVPLDLWMKGFLGMAALMLVQSSITLTKTLRDVEEARKFVNRIEDAKTERLLMDVAKAP